MNGRDCDKRKKNPSNVDFYSASLLYCIGIPIKKYHENLIWYFYLYLEKIRKKR